MNKPLVVALLISLTTCSIAWSQQPPQLQWRTAKLPAAPAATDDFPVAPPAEINQDVPPNAWLYLQEQKRWDDPKLAVRRKAEFRAAQRQKRLAAMRWFGYDKVRPMASTTPSMDVYSPFWSGNSNHPYIWIGQGWPSLR